MFMILLWVGFGLLSLGILGINAALIKHHAKKPWRLNIDKSYLPTVTILVPTYNESDVIRFKLENLRKL
ncbi:MAG: hypothetical protein QXD19_02520, partial [Candidatus Bathyarchaeia archaeon]